MNMEKSERGESVEQLNERQFALDEIYAADKNLIALLTQEKIEGGVASSSRREGQTGEQAIAEATDQVNKAKENCEALGITEDEWKADYQEREQRIKEEALDELAESAKAIGIKAEESVANPQHYEWGQSDKIDRFKKAWQHCRRLGINSPDMDEGWKSRN